MNESLNRVLNSSRKATYKNPKWGTSEALGKLMEESGEFARAVLIESARMIHKDISSEDDVFEEGADAIMCIIDILGKLSHEDMSNNEIVAKLKYWLDKKREVWERKVGL